MRTDGADVGPTSARACVAEGFPLTASTIIESAESIRTLLPHDQGPPRQKLSVTPASLVIKPHDRHSARALYKILRVEPANAGLSRNYICGKYRLSRGPGGLGPTSDRTWTV